MYTFRVTCSDRGERYAQVVEAETAGEAVNRVRIKNDHIVERVSMRCEYVLANHNQCGNFSCDGDELCHAHRYADDADAYRVK